MLEAPEVREVDEEKIDLSLQMLQNADPTGEIKPDGPELTLYESKCRSFGNAGFYENFYYAPFKGRRRSPGIFWLNIVNYTLIYYFSLCLHFYTTSQDFYCPFYDRTWGLPFFYSFTFDL